MKPYKTIALFLSATILLGCIPKSELAEDKESKPYEAVRPKLVVGLVVDQMRYDFITRYWEDYSDDGFKRLMKGFVGHDHHFSYAPTYTGPGHASVYTGTTPEIHGVIANDWFDKSTAASVYCAYDTLAIPTGTESSAGKMSPHRMLTTTIGDELKLHSVGLSKVIGISLKDRGAILPAGHSADGAYWYVGGEEGVFVSSDHYCDTLPQWVTAFNGRNRAVALIKQGWQRMYEESVYDESLADNNPYEAAFTGSERPVFPYDLEALAPQNGNLDIIKSTPHGNKLTIELAKAAIAGEQLGTDRHTDLLAVSFSATDYIGHQFGPQSQEAQDAYLRLDEEISAFLKYLDNTVGENEYVVFLTADHGAVHVPSYLDNLQIPSGYWNPGNMVEDVKAMLSQKFGPGNWVLNYSNDQFFLDHVTLDSTGVEAEDVEEAIINMVLGYEGVQYAFGRHQLLSPGASSDIAQTIKRGYNPSRSGDVVVVKQPGWLQYSTRTGTSHGSPYAYDTHTPLMIMGPGIAREDHYGRTEIRDIAPTICALIGIQMPNGCTGKVIRKALD